MDKWVKGNVIEKKNWTKNLFSIIINASIKPFTAGQFAKIALYKDKSTKIQRAYSYVNAPSNPNLEFYIVKVSKGKLSNLLNELKPGDNLMITKKSSGNFILNTIPKCKNLWMISTGTALGPYLSILEEGYGLERFEKIILVHAVRFYKDLSYLPKMLKLQFRYKKQLKIQTIISRENIQSSLHGRIPDLIKNGILESRVNLNLDKKNSHVMLCGNPNMVRDTQELLKKKYDMRKNFKNQYGNITFEKYW